MTTLPAIGSFVLVPFGDGKKQVAHVVKHTRTERVIVRAFNRSKGEWMPGTRTLDADQLQPASEGWTAGLPSIPA